MLEYNLVRSGRKTISAQILRDGSILVRAPRFCPISVIEDFLQKKEAVLLGYREKVLSMPSLPTISRQELDSLRDRARKLILPRVAELSDATGLNYNGAKITTARQRFGSCNGANHLCFSAFLALATQEEIDYVIIHELCHTLEHNHSSRFYAHVARFMPDWKDREKSLKKMTIPEIGE